MNSHYDEKKLIDYVLGELDPDEKEKIEEGLNQSAELRRQVEEIRETVSILSEGLSKEAPLRLPSEMRIQIEREATESGRRSFLTPTLYHYAAGVLAASLVLVVFLNLPRGLTLDPGTLSPRATELASDLDGGTGVNEIPPSEQVSRSAMAEPAADSGTKPETSLPASTARDDHRSVENDSSSIPRTNGPAAGNSLVMSEVKAKEQVQTEGDENAVLKVERRAIPITVADSVSSRTVHSAPTGVTSEGLTDGNQGGIARLTAPSAEMAQMDAVNSSMVRLGADAPADTLEVVPVPRDAGFDREAYDRIDENDFIRVRDQPLSTFSIDVDTASYSNIRRFLNQKQIPPPDAVRVEELINYFSYDYPEPTGKDPFSVNVETASAPWNPNHLLVRFGLKGKEIDVEGRKPANFVFLIDVSGSMRPANKLPLLKRAFRMLVEQFDERDRVAIVVYAGASGLVLPSTSCRQKEKILQSLDQLEAGGSTNGGSGITLAYRAAEEHYLQDGINRVILATDGDFNVGTTNQGELTRLIEEKARSGVFLTVLGFGMGNYQDSNLERLADRGNGNYAYIDSLQEAKKVLVEEMGSTLVTIAKDVKIQVEFNPARVSAYRLIGYENRLLRNQDFNDDRKDAGEIGAGHTVTAFYEIVPPGVEVETAPGVDPLRYQTSRSRSGNQLSDELLTLKLRYKQPDGDGSQLIETPVSAGHFGFWESSADFKFAAAVAGFGMLLRESDYKGILTFDQVIEIAERSVGRDAAGYRAECVRLMKIARAITEIEELESKPY